MYELCFLWLVRHHSSCDYSPLLSWFLPFLCWSLTDFSALIAEIVQFPPQFSCIVLFKGPQLQYHVHSIESFLLFGGVVGADNEMKSICSAVQNIRIWAWAATHTGTERTFYLNSMWTLIKRGWGNTGSGERPSVGDSSLRDADLVLESSLTCRRTLSGGLCASSMFLLSDMAEVFYAGWIRCHFCRWLLSSDLLLYSHVGSCLYMFLAK